MKKCLPAYPCAPHHQRTPIPNPNVQRPGRSQPWSSTGNKRALGLRLNKAHTPPLAVVDDLDLVVLLVLEHVEVVVDVFEAEHGLLQSDGLHAEGLALDLAHVRGGHVGDGLLGHLLGNLSVEGLVVRDEVVAEVSSLGLALAVRIDGTLLVLAKLALDGVGNLVNGRVHVGSVLARPDHGPLGEEGDLNVVGLGDSGVLVVHKVHLALGDAAANLGESFPHLVVDVILEGRRHVDVVPADVDRDAHAHAHTRLRRHGTEGGGSRAEAGKGAEEERGGRKESIRLCGQGRKDPHGEGGRCTPHPF
mmetsp:Transcript_22594/g.55722  ORF Transcript_22594/g.55722 Transcript_22594/m.55722 type:complete len:305 (-) Transcript_22594:116-1030(-)